MSPDPAPLDLGQSRDEIEARAWVDKWGELAAEMALKCANWAATFDRDIEEQWDGIRAAIEKARQS